MRNFESGKLERFVQAQEGVYASALAEILAGRKQTHWMWFIFPQLLGLGSSPTARFYAIQGTEEAEDYLAHVLLGPRLIESSEAVLVVEGKTAEEIFGYPDFLKLRSCATLFAQVSEGDSVFQKVLKKYYAGEPDGDTLRLIGSDRS